MFNAWQPEINYIGKLTIHMPGLVYNTEIYPISSIKALSDKALIVKIFNKEYLKLIPKSPNIDKYRPFPKFTKEGPLVYKVNIWDSRDTKWSVRLEIYEESKLRENKEFLWVQI